MTRRLVLAALVLAVALIVAPVFVPAHAFVRRGVLDGVEVLVAVGALVMVGAAAIGPRRAGPPRFVVRDGTFAVPPNRQYGYWIVTQLCFVAMAGSRAVDSWTHRGEMVSLHADEYFAGLMAVPFGLLAVATALLVPRLLRGRPVLWLTPEALVVRDPVGSRTFPWVALVPWGPWRGGYLQTVRLVVARPDLVVRVGSMRSSSDVSLRYADVHRWFFVDAVRYYILRPDLRAGIGTAEGYARLLADLGVAGRGAAVELGGGAA